MSKGLWVGGVIVLAGAGYAAGTVYTGQQVNEQFNKYVESVKQSSSASVAVTSSVDASLFSSANTLTFEMNDLPESILELTGTNVMSFNIDYSHSFLASKSVMTLAEGELLANIKSYQKNTQIAPLIINSHYSYDIASNKVKIVGDLATDNFVFKDDANELSIGASAGSFSLADESMNLDWLVQPSLYVNELGRADIGALGWKQTAQVLSGDILTAGLAQKGDAQVTLDSFKVDGSGTKLDISKLLVNVAQDVVADRIKVKVTYAADSIVSENAYDQFEFKKPVLDLSFDLDFQGASLFVDGIGELQKDAGGIAANPAALMDLLSGITNKGIVFNVDRVEVEANDAALKGDAQLKLAPFAVQEAMFDREAFMKKVDLNAKLVMANKFLEYLPNYNPEQISFFVGMGFLSEEGDDLAIKLAVKDGVINLNGQPMPGF
ncbi:DUF945 family protein [Gammaproteobacteria bacterium AS21]|jgi:hypothetical protein